MLHRSFAWISLAAYLVFSPTSADCPRDLAETTPTSLATEVQDEVAADSAKTEDRRKVREAVQNYVVAIYESKPELIDTSVHPAMQKTGCYRRPGAKTYNTRSNMNFEQLRALAKSWNANGSQGKDLKYTIDLETVLDKTASVKLSAAWGIDHMQLLKQDGRWRIIHVLWQSYPPKAEKK